MGPRYRIVSVFVYAAMLFKCTLAALFFVQCSAFIPSTGVLRNSLPRKALTSRSPAISMLEKKGVTFDESGIFDPREQTVSKPKVVLLNRIQQLRVASKVAQLGLLSQAEAGGVFSKLESAGAFSTAESLLPLVDELQLLTTAEKLINVPAVSLVQAAFLLVAFEGALIFAIPDDSGLLLLIQALTGLLAGAGAVALVGGAFVLSAIQGE